MKDKMGVPRRVDLTPAGRAFRSAKSRIKHFKSILQGMIDAARAKGNELEVHYLEEVCERLSDDANDPRYSARRLNDLYDGAMLAAHPSLRKMLHALGRLPRRFDTK